MLLTALMRIVLTRSFKPFVFRGTCKRTLDYESLENLGLYIHIPFCRSLCSFCPYCKVVYNEELAQRYKKALLQEIEAVCKQQTRNKQVTSLYFGGGTPALMAEHLGDIILKIKQYFDIGGGIGVELHPDDLSAQTLETLKNAGVSMVSVGIQSFDEHCLAKIGRSGVGFEQKLKLVQEYGFDVVDVDLIFGIPGQNKSVLKKDLQTAFENGATQISTYPFIDFTFADNKYKPVSHKEKKEMLDYLNGVCGEMGVKRTSVWTFAKKDTQRYSSVTRDCFLGFGVSATTLLQDVFKINTFSIEEYIRRIEYGLLPTSLTLDFTRRQRAVYALFWSAYSLEIDRNGFERIMGQTVESMFSFELWVAKRLGLIALAEEAGKYILTDRAARFYHRVEQQYTRAYIDKMWNISRETPFPEKIILR